MELCSEDQDLIHSYKTAPDFQHPGWSRRTNENVQTLENQHFE